MTAVNSVRRMGPELMTSATASDPISGFLANSFLGESISYHVTKDLSDAEPAMIDKNAFANFGKFYPAGCSFQQLNHFRQLVLTGEYRKYKYDTVIENQKKYGTNEPPLYNLDNIKGFNICLVCGKGDLLASKKDYDWVYEEL